MTDKKPIIINGWDFRDEKGLGFWCPRCGWHKGMLGHCGLCEGKEENIIKFLTSIPTPTTHHFPRGYVTIPELVKRHRKALCMSQDLYASTIGVSRVTVANWEIGKSCPPAQLIEMLFNNYIQGI